MSENLKRLREYAQIGHEKKCRDEIFELFKDLPPRDVLQIIIDQMKAYLPIFEKFYPDILWPRKWLEKLELFQPIQGYQIDGHGIWDENRIFDEQGISKPGATSFLAAIDNCYFAFQEGYLSGYQAPFLEGVSGALICITGARTHVFWAQIDPAGYELWDRPLSDTPENQAAFEKSDAAMMRFFDSPGRIAFSRQLYLSIADQIEAAMNKSNDSLNAT